MTEDPGLRTEHQGARIGLRTENRGLTTGDPEQWTLDDKIISSEVDLYCYILTLWDITSSRDSMVHLALRVFLRVLRFPSVLKN